MKLHGSVNWGKCEACGAIAPWTLQDFFKTRSWDLLGVRRGADSVELNVGDQIAAFQHCKDKRCESDSVIVPPTWNKAEYQQVANVWKHAAHHLSEAENIIVIGYSLPEADQFFRFLFAVGTIGPARP